MHTIDRRQARRFLLAKQGLIGPKRFSGKQGVLDYIGQAGCIQFDPVDVCGKNPELVLHARVQGFTKPMLDSLLYRDRQLVDYFDKQLSILPMSDWPHFAATRQASRGHLDYHSDIPSACEAVKKIIRQRGPSSSADIELGQSIQWYWGNNTRMSRVALETLYYMGELMVHHKHGSNKVYALAEDLLPRELLDAPDPCPDPFERLCWRIRRRIGSVGLLWDRNSDAFLGIGDYTAEGRRAAFAHLLARGEILPVQVEGRAHPLYYLAEDEPLMQRIVEGERFRARTELIAPLDNLLWDRKLIQMLFGFSYQWEVYTPVVQRKYGSYTLPILRGERFVGRVQLSCQRAQGVTRLDHLWLESGVRLNQELTAALTRCFARLAAFNGCPELAGWPQTD